MTNAPSPSEGFGGSAASTEGNAVILPNMDMSDWNAAHRTLLRARAGFTREIETVRNEVDELRNEIAEKLNRIDTLNKNISDVDAAILDGDFKIPDGFDVWGDLLEPKVRLINPAMTTKIPGPLMPPTGIIR